MQEPDHHTTAVAERIRLARRLAGMTQEDAARALDVTVRTYARWENAETSGFLGVLEAIARLFDTTPEHLLGDGEDAPDFGAIERELRALRAEIAELRADLRALIVSAPSAP